MTKKHGTTAAMGIVLTVVFGFIVLFAACALLVAEPVERGLYGVAAAILFHGFTAGK